LSVSSIQPLKDSTIERKTTMSLYLFSLLNAYTAMFDREEGQGMAEYALIIALVAVALVMALGGLKGGIDGVFSDIVGAFGATTPN
jgi:pilus assembly protein Flp/PilA